MGSESGFAVERGSNNRASDKASISVLSVACPSRPSATFSASAAGAATSGFTPTPSQFVPVVGFSPRPPGMNIPKSGVSGAPPPGLAPPPVVSPTIVASFSACMS